jgi:hypothetical protein
MTQAGGSLGLILEPPQLLGVESRREWEHLERHAPPKRQLLGFVHDAHAPSAQLSDELKVAERFTRQRSAVQFPAERGKHLQSGQQFAQALGVFRVCPTTGFRVDHIAALQLRG